MKSTSNGGVLKGRLQVLHVHVLLVAPLGAGYMAQPGTDQHQGRVAVWKTAHHPRAASDLPVQSLNHIIGGDAGSVFAGKIAVGQHFLNAILYLLGGLFQFHGAQFPHHQFGLVIGIRILQHLTGAEAAIFQTVGVDVGDGAGLWAPGVVDQQFCVDTKDLVEQILIVVIRGLSDGTPGNISHGVEALDLQLSGIPLPDSPEIGERQVVPKETR